MADLSRCWKMKRKIFVEAFEATLGVIAGISITAVLFITLFGLAIIEEREKQEKIEKPEESVWGYDYWKEEWYRKNEKFCVVSTKKSAVIAKKCVMSGFEADSCPPLRCYRDKGGGQDDGTARNLVEISLKKTEVILNLLMLSWYLSDGEMPATVRNRNRNSYRKKVRYEWF